MTQTEIQPRDRAVAPPARRGRAALLVTGWCLALAFEPACAPTALIGYDELVPAADAAEPTPDAGDDAAMDAEVLDAEVPDAEDADAELSDAGPDATKPDAALGPWTVLPWSSGVHYGNEPPSYDEFAAFRGRPLAVVTLYPERATWAGINNPDWWFDNFENYPARLVLSEPLYPIGPPTAGNNKDCAAGLYDAEWRTLGTFLARRGPDSIVRLGWGPNDPTHEWHADADPANFIACFRRIVGALRAAAPRVLIDFSFDPVPSMYPASGNPYDLYPGDEYVDIVGMDVFDHQPPTRNEAEWEAKCHGPLGLCTLIEFARQHKKRFSVGEWGVATCGEQPGGDNALFVEKMVQTFHDNADVLAYEAYFDDSGADVCSSIMSTTIAPLARAAYRRLYQVP